MSFYIVHVQFNRFFSSLRRMTQNNCWWFIKGESIKSFHLIVPAVRERLLGGAPLRVSWSVTWSDVAGQTPFYKMELSESAQRGLRFLANPSVFDRTSFQVLVDVSFRSLLSSPGDPSVLGELRSPARRRLLFCSATSCVFPGGWSERGACVSACAFACWCAFWYAVQHVWNRILRVCIKIFEEPERSSRQPRVSCAKATLASLPALHSHHRTTSSALCHSNRHQDDNHLLF